MLNRLLSLVFAGFYYMRDAHWVLPLVLAFFGLYNFGHDNGWALGWGVAAGAVVYVTVLARQANYVCFEPVEGSAHPLDAPKVPAICQATALGQLWGRTDYGNVLHPYLGVAVQVRWLEREPFAPVLAALRPADLAADVRVPLARAAEWSLWYPGTEVEAGQVYFKGRVYPGIRVRFLGKQLLLAVESEELAQALVHTLRQAETGRAPGVA